MEKRKVAKSDTEVGHEDALIGMELVSGHQQQCLVHLLQEVPVVRGGGGQYYSQNQAKGLTSASFVKCPSMI